MNKVLVGTSGFFFWHWRGRFYPADLKPSRWLDYYWSQGYQMLEINSTYHQMPSRESMKRWRRQCPPGREYVVKMFRGVTHWKGGPLADEGQWRTAVWKFQDAVRHLEEKCLVWLHQFPPSFKRTVENAARLRAYVGHLHGLVPGIAHAFEFRDPGWYCEDTQRELKLYSEALVQTIGPPGVGDLGAGVITSMTITYLRFHGSLGWFTGSYSDARLAAIAENCRYWADQCGRKVIVAFNNDSDPAKLISPACEDAKKFQAMVRAKHTEGVLDAVGGTQ